jgi:hypothetical protein
MSATARRSESIQQQTYEVTPTLKRASTLLQAGMPALPGLFVDDPEGIIGDAFPVAVGIYAGQVYDVVAVFE